MYDMLCDILVCCKQNTSLNEVRVLFNAHLQRMKHVEINIFVS